MKTLKPPVYTPEESEKIIEYVVALRKPLLQEFLQRVNLAKSGTKESIGERLQDALDEGTLEFTEIVAFLDEVTPWGKQHVFLFRGPTQNIATWKDSDWLSEHLKNARVGRYLNARLPLVLPAELSLSSIEHSPTRLRVTAVQGHEWWDREQEYDRSDTTPAGEHVALRAFVRQVDRGLIAFEWDLRANTAILQITQLPGDSKYEEAAAGFNRLVDKWLPFEAFSYHKIGPAIKRLHEAEENGVPEARSHGIDYVTMLGRRLGARSASSRDSVLGEAVIDSAMKSVREQGVGRIGNFYWLPPKIASGGHNPLSEEVHVVLLGEKSRLNFPTPNKEPVVRYVLSRVRALSSRPL